MPRLLPRARKFKPDDLVRPLQSFSGNDEDGVPFVLNPSDRLRADHPIVRRLPQHFVRADSADSEIREARTAFAAEFPEARPARDERIRILDPIPEKEAAVAAETFSAGDRFVQKGQRLRRSDPLVRAYPELFATPATPLDKLESAVDD
jgi:hypothetical protein